MIEQYRLYLRAAKLKNADPSAIFESAATDPNLNAKQLGQLASVLGERHGYRLPKSMRDPLIDRLLEAGVKAKRISDLTGCHPRTVARRQDAQVGSTNGMDKRCRPDKTEPRSLGTHPVLFCPWWRRRRSGHSPDVVGWAMSAPAVKARCESCESSFGEILAFENGTLCQVAFTADLRANEPSPEVAA